MSLGLIENFEAGTPYRTPRGNLLSVVMGQNENAHPDLIRLEARASRSVGREATVLWPAKSGTVVCNVRKEVNTTGTERGRSSTGATRPTHSSGVSGRGSATLTEVLDVCPLPPPSTQTHTHTHTHTGANGG